MQRGAKPPIRENAIAVLAVIPAEEDRDALRRLFRGSNWLPSFAGSIAETMRRLKQSPTAVVLCDRDLPDGSWKDLLAATGTLMRPPRLVLTSRLADERLWTEALNLGCHEVLPQPFRASELFLVISFAWRSWQAGAEDPINRVHALADAAATSG
jgi:DNA-binding response OmpR family regulator